MNIECKQTAQKRLQKFAKLLKSGLCDIDDCEEIEKMIDDDDKKLGVITESHLFKELGESGLHHHRPTISELLEELQKIHLEEPIEIEAPIRKDRYNSIDEIEYLKEG